ncbi:transcriptional regulator [Pontibacillus salicampi]|uniref:Transcriptional regulator n=1 Tax=Pontibacillus salicampi TaxID=1449801 RepID=A0ABV6LKB2_9BACI
MIEKNKLVFDQAIRTADILVEMMGSRCEVAVHDFRNLDQSLIHLAGSITDREIGSPITSLVLEQLKNAESNVDDFANYKTVSHKGHVMKSSTVFLYDDENEVIGALCVNIDVSLLIQLGGEIQDFITFNDQRVEKESFYTTVHDVVEDMIEHALQELNKTPAMLNKEEKIEVIRILEKKGTFLIKGSTEYLAKVLGVSKYTIYNYLQQIRTEENFNAH